jgi:hypothetical protein
MSRTMTSKERWLAALRLQPVDRLPFWPKLSGAYPPAQRAPFASMTLPQLQAWTGSDPHVWLPGCLREVRKRSTVESVRSGDVARTLYTCPEGRLEMIQHFDAGSQAWHPVKFPVQTVNDIRLMTRIAEDASFELDPALLEKARTQAEALGSPVLTVNPIGTTPLMVWIEYLAGVEGAHWLLPDLARVGAHAFEAFTAPTLGNATLLDGRTACPDVCLIGGTHAMLWTQPAKAIIAGIEAALNELPHHRGLGISSAGVMPPQCVPETIRTVCDWVKSFPARM